MHRVTERLGVQTRIKGFDNESAMVNSLAATPTSLTQTCFAHGAGNVILIWVVILVFMSRQCAELNAQLT